MSYSVRIPKKYFGKLKEMCKEYKSYRECIMKELEKRHNVKIYSSIRSNDMGIKNDFNPREVYIIFYEEENERLGELAEKLETSKYKLIMSLFE